MAEVALDDGRALEAFRRAIAAQGGDVAVLDDPDRLPAAPVVVPARVERAGSVVAMDTRAIGEAAVALGAGRRSMDDRINPAVGFIMEVKPGSAVAAGDPLAVIHAADEAAAEAAASALRAAITIGEGEGSWRPLVSHRVTAAGTDPLT